MVLDTKRHERMRVRSRTRNRLAQRGLPVPFPDRGRLWYDFEIAKEFFQDLPGIERKVRWIREHLPKETRIKVGQKVRMV
jgi:hypothetical protein